MELRSMSFEPGQEIPPRHGKRFDNLSPGLSWSEVPEGTKSFALSVIDHHPVAHDYVHWAVVGIPASVNELAEGAELPAGAIALTAYAGPFPPAGTHDYTFTLYALDVETVDQSASFDGTIEGHVLATAVLIGSFTKR